MRVITDSWVMAAMIRSAPRSAKGTRGHSQIKYAAQQPAPMPVGGASFRLLPVHTRLA